MIRKKNREKGEAHEGKEIRLGRRCAHPSAEHGLSERGLSTAECGRRTRPRAPTSARRPSTDRGPGADRRPSTADRSPKDRSVC